MIEINGYYMGDENEEILLILNTIKKYLKVKGDMLVMKNISRHKNGKDFDRIEKFLQGCH